MFRHFFILSSITSLFLLIFFINLKLIFASHFTFLTSGQLNELSFTNYEKINPNLQIYPLKRTVENLKLNLLLDERQKRKYLYKLFEKRFSELIYILNYKKEGFYIETIDRYNTFAGMVKSKLADDKDKDQIVAFSTILQKLRDRYPSGSAYWKKIQEAVDTTESLL